MTQRRNHALRERKSAPLCDHRLTPEFTDYCARVLLPQIEFAGRKRAEQVDLALQILHNLVVMGQKAACVSDGRDTHEPGSRLRVRVWDAIEQAGFARKRLGSQMSGRMTRYLATSELLRHFKDWELQNLVDVSLHRNTRLSVPTEHALVLLRPGKRDLQSGNLIPEHLRKKAIPFPNDDPWVMVKYLESLEDIVERVNLNNSSVAWQAFAVDPSSGKRRVFGVDVCIKLIYSGRVFRGGRLYTHGQRGGQQLTKKERRTCRCGGERVAELDFSGLHTRMLYHMQEHDPQGDIYRPERVLPKFYHSRLARDPDAAKAVRTFTKRATNVCWNVDSRSKANSSVGRLLATSPDSDLLRDVIYRIEKTDPKVLVRRLMKVHRPLRRYFFSGIGMKLQMIDGFMMLNILSRFADASVPVLPIHDSVVCRVRDLKLARRTMRQVYRDFFGYPPHIERSF